MSPSAESPARRAPSEIAIESRERLRDWLAAHHADHGSVWLVLWKKESGKPVVGYDEVVDECLCVGWVDGLPGKVDARRWKIRVSPRDPASNWSGVNRRKVARLEREGRMREAGRAAIARAKARGTWTFLDDVERLELPHDLVRALDATRGARDFFERFPDSSKRGILEWIKSAKKPGTRAKRVEETATKAARNRKANHPAGRDAGPKPKPVS